MEAQWTQARPTLASPTLARRMAVLRTLARRTQGSRMPERRLPKSCSRTTSIARWRDNDKANSDASTLDRAAPSGVSCADCSIDAKMVNFAGGEAMLELRGSGSDRYALALTAGGALEVRRYQGGVKTVLGGVPSGLADLKTWHAFSFAVQGDHPVTLTASVDGVPKMSVTDAAASALGAAGAAGIAATASGILFDDFVLTGSGSGR